MDSGVARGPILDLDAYREELKARLNPTTSVLTLAYEGARRIPSASFSPRPKRKWCCARRSSSATAAMAFRCWSAAKTCPNSCARWASRDAEEFELDNSRISPLVPKMVDYLYQRLQRRGLSAPRCGAHGQSGSQHLRLATARAGRGRCDDHRRHAHLFADHARGAARARPGGGRTPFGIHCSSARTTPCSWPTRRSPSARRAEELADIAEHTARGRPVDGT